MARKIIYREVPKPPGPSGEIGLDLWRAIKDRYSQEWEEYTETYVEESDLDWLQGYMAATRDDMAKRQCWDLIEAIKALKQVEVVWINE